jgi:MFS family permease
MERGQGLLAVYLLLFAINSVAAGVAALPFLNIVAKTVPPGHRGAYFGWRRFLGGLLGLAAGVLVRAVLSPDFGLAFPSNYAVLFFLGFLITVVLVGSFSLVVEPAEAVDPRRVGLREQLGRAVRLPLRDRNYARYLVLRVLVVVTGFTVPFYAVYARRELGASGDMVGVYLVGLTTASVLSNLILGRVSDRLGNRLLLRLAAITVTLPAATALLVARSPQMALDRSLAFVLVFVFQGLHTTAQVIGGTNYLLELNPSIERVLYVGLASGVVGLAFFASPLGGALVDWLGFEALFLVALVCALLAVGISLRLEEPRRRQTMPVTQA